MKKTLTIAAAVAALAIGTQAFAAGPTPVAGSATTAPAATSATTPSTTAAPAAPAAMSGQPAAPAASSTAAPAAPAGKQAAASSKLDAMTCADYQKRVDDAIGSSKDAAKLDHAKKNREEGAKLCSSGKHEAGVKHFRTALRDLGVSKTQ